MDTSTAEREVKNLQKRLLEALLKYEAIQNIENPPQFSDFCKSYIKVYMKDTN